MKHLIISLTTKIKKKHYNKIVLLSINLVTNYIKHSTIESCYKYHSKKI